MDPRQIADVLHVEAAKQLHCRVAVELALVQAVEEELGELPAEQ